MTRASFLLKITLISVFHVLKTYGNADVPKANPLASITEVKVRFMPSLPLMEFNCFTRYNISESQPISLYRNDQLIHSVSTGDHLSHEIEDAEPGEYKCQVGSNEFKFHLPNHMNVLSLSIIEISYHANLVTGQTQVEYENFDPGSSFLCKQGGIEMEEAYHDVIAEVESIGYNGTLKPKTKTDYKCFINNDQFEFSATNNVEDLYPQINAFHVYIMPDPLDGNNDFVLYVSCQTRTANNPKIMLFVNHHDLMVNIRENYASFYTQYDTQIAFKCIVENEFGRDVLSWGGQETLKNYLNQKDSFTYTVDVDKQITKMVYRPAQPRNLENVRCSVEEKNQYYQYRTVQKSNKEKLFTEAIDKFVRYTCEFIENKEFKTELYTKDWLQVPKLSDVKVKAKPSRSDPGRYYVEISCMESVKTYGSNFSMSLIDGDKTFNFRKDIWGKSSHGLTSFIYPAYLTKTRCVVENDMGYDMLTADYKTQVPKDSEVQLKIFISPDNDTSSTDDITSTFDYKRPEDKEREKTYCKHNNASEIEKNHFYLQNSKEDNGEYSCISNTEFCKDPGLGIPCWNDTYSMQLMWTRKLLSQFPDGSLRQGTPNDKFSSFFGFYAED